MARTKEFDPEEVLERAIECFRRRGFHASSVELLTAAMGLGRGSLYATFTDKRALFDAALNRYAEQAVANIVGRLDRAKEPLAEIAAVLWDVAKGAAADRNRQGCLMTNSATELAGEDREIAHVIAQAFLRIEDGFYRALRRAQGMGTLDGKKNPRALARFFVGVMQGLMVMSRVNADPEVLNDIVVSALDSLG